MSSGPVGGRLRQWTNHDSPDSVAARCRQARFDVFVSLLNRLPRPWRILDIGGEAGFWTAAPAHLLADLDVTLLNLMVQPNGDSRFRRVKGDARYLPFLSDHEFDVVFSNSVIEHLGNFEEQRKMADEVRRVGKTYFVQTPSKWFPLEPHFLFPCFQFLPFVCRVWLASHYRGGWYCHPGDPEGARREVESIRLLTSRECRTLFPGAEVRVERMFGWTKSYMIVGG